ncbi:MAG TPA: gliding motility lipoprotein GldH [Cyclobacteriaceae bacterium]|nr:gliding motility lipoprotein GldH [Cyclobacteriaceae bacterium]HMV11032.1 gliding motility lipoprotein GldH [Cyclobacteriaceae bacterium]HMV88631.1 gliding motility lipoprotein GldH [Cyclobacteriaceae bacterium]HMX00607.1 gliding motility lipoprotein GldH [Cyclobacteriaceae bacterium]HMX49518.1 gliding motility lipoprotein GldH [Cyclobacteriaceae bacterium]
MRILFFLLLIVFLSGCDRSRLYEKNHDFEERAWIVSDQPVFDFDITDTVKTYNLYCNIRNSVKYPYSRIFINYSLQDSTGTSVSKNLISAFLFEEKTGKPFGSSGLGDVYDQQVPVLKKFKFNKPGKYSMKFEQFMRTDTLAGIHAVGFRLETASIE